MSAKTIILSTPQGWGKTLNKKALQQEFGCTKVVEDWWPGHCTLEGALHLTHAPAAQIDAGYMLTAELVCRGWEQPAIATGKAIVAQGGSR